MSDYTITSKVNRLLQKSRQAYRIYSAMCKTAKIEHNEYSELQALEWMNINAELIKQLSKAIEQNLLKGLSNQVHKVQYSLSLDLSEAEKSLDIDQQELIACSQRGDFIRSAQLSRKLISKKSFVQAAQAAICELQAISGASCNIEVSPESGAISLDIYNSETISTALTNKLAITNSAKESEGSARFSSALIKQDSTPARVKKKLEDTDTGLAKVIQLRR